MTVESLRVDRARTEDRLNRAREIGDTAAVMIAESRMRRLDAELEIALGIQRPSTSTAPIMARR